jgi:hypothetical protein
MAPTVVSVLLAGNHPSSFASAAPAIAPFDTASTVSSAAAAFSSSFACFDAWASCSLQLGVLLHNLVERGRLLDVGHFCSLLRAHRGAGPLWWLFRTDFSGSTFSISAVSPRRPPQ